MATQYYLVQGAKLSCNQGSVQTLCMLPLPHGVYYHNKSMLRVSDCQVGVNILPFGLCTITQKPCLPAITGQWMKPHNKAQINGVSAITTDSFLVCSLGGMIEPQNSGQ